MNNTEQDFTFLATFNKDFNEKIGMKFMAGFNANERKFNRFTSVNNEVIDANLLILGATNKQSSLEQNRKQRLYGIFGELALSYNNYAFLTASLRNDHSSTLPTNNNSYLYPAVTGSLVFTEALNLPKTVINFGKVRANFATVGKDAPPYLTNTNLFLNTGYNGSTAAATASYTNPLSGVSQVGNPELKPEFTTEFEIGTELQFFNSRIGLDLAYFNRNSTDLIVTARIPSSSGFDFRTVNAGKINNNGIEAGITIVPIKTKSGFTWTSFAAFTRLRSEVVDAGPGGELIITGVGDQNLGTIFRPGQPYGMIYGSQNTRDKSGNLLINESTGFPFTQSQSQIIGNPAPDYTLGWTNTFTYKNFTLSSLLDYRKGGKMFSVTAASLILRGQLKSSEDREGNRVIPGVYGDPQTYEPILQDGKVVRNTTPITAFDSHFTDGFGAYGADETNVYDVTVFRVREVTLGYKVPKAFLTKHLKFLGALNFSVSGRNLFFVAPNMLKGLNFDPEVLSSFADSNVQGFDLGASPSTRRFGFNLTAKF